MAIQAGDCVRMRKRHAASPKYGRLDVGKALAVGDGAIEVQWPDGKRQIYGLNLLRKSSCKPRK